ncbi:DUF269 domain-containing protein [Oscillatoria sp. FACHB-1406]|uniref:DUF269 domain-containing protein n=1 Tax=Oscillatoria sp. FACHB-1406 TaxID=2692846 RepID=UPI0016847097|nr:DUF269 domain-containing protein [Oscillatoria sp. FACHB-1406]MBD2577792.1 DUF269 domain-containing protein [Oscillatoria sp. FACHB-1406]
MSKTATLPPKPKLSLLPTVRSFSTRKKPRRARNSFFLQALVQQVRHQDRLGLFQHTSDSAILQLFLTNEGETLDSRSRISAFYGAVAAEIERITGKQKQLFINLNSSDLGSVLIFCDRLLVLSDLLRNVNCFQFAAIEQLRDRGETEINSALNKTYRYFEF